MIARDTIKKGIVERADALKRIKYPRKFNKESKPPMESLDYIEGIVDVILNKIDEINSLPEFSERIWDKGLRDVMIAEEWRDFILPESVRFDPTDLKTNNVLIKGSSTPSQSVSDYSEFLNAQMRFRGLFKKDVSTGMIPLSELFVKKSIYDVLPIAAMEVTGETGAVRSLDDPFIPVKINSDLRCLFRKDYFNSTIEQVVQDYLSKKTF